MYHKQRGKNLGFLCCFLCSLYEKQTSCVSFLFLAFGKKGSTHEESVSPFSFTKKERLGDRVFLESAET